MSKRNRERRAGEGPADPAGNGNGTNWLPIVLAVGALGLGFIAWTDSRSLKTDMNRQLAAMQNQIGSLTTQVANAAKAKPQQQQGPDPNKVYTVKTEGAPTEGPANAPIVIAEFSDYQ